MAGDQKPKRATRVAEGVREELSALIARTVRDPRVRGVTIGRVDMTDDLRRARVLVRLLEGGDDDARREEAIEGLSRASGLLRREVTKRLGLRYAPELVFVYDDGQDAASRIEQLLAEVEAEKKTTKRE
jgi:ribosome-binding factor A